MRRLTGILIVFSVTCPMHMISLVNFIQWINIKRMSRLWPPERALSLFLWQIKIVIFNSSIMFSGSCFSKWENERKLYLSNPEIVIWFIWENQVSSMLQKDKNRFKFNKNTIKKNLKYRMRRASRSLCDIPPLHCSSNGLCVLTGKQTKIASG